MSTNRIEQPKLIKYFNHFSVSEKETNALSIGVSQSNSEHPANDSGLVCLELCHRYLEDVPWLQAGLGDIKVTKMGSNGSTSQSYLVELKQHSASPSSADGTCPKKVVIKLYRNKHKMFLPNLHSPEEIVWEEGKYSVDIPMAIISTTDLTPQVYGFFKQGLIREYCEVCCKMLFMQLVFKSDFFSA